MKYRTLKEKIPKRSNFKFVILAIFSAAILLTASMFSQDMFVSAEDYTFTENIIDGTSTNPTNRNAEDGSYNTMTETDQYTDTNYSGSTENVVTGTAGGGSFPSALDTDDATRRSYTEANSAGSPSSSTLVPTSDIATGFDTIYPVSPTTHYDKVDEGASHDSASTYCRAVTNGDEDIYGLGDMSDPGTADLDVTIHIIMQDAGTGNSAVDAGVYISSTRYVGVNDQIAPNAWADHTYTWELNPNTAAEWTYAGINAMGIYITVADAAPDVDVTSFYIVVSITPSATYTLDAQITYSSVASSSQTTNFQVLCQGYRNVDTESIKIQAWNYTSSAWVDKITITASSDTDYNFNLLGWAANCERSSGNVVLLRAVDSSGDSTQTVTYLDMMKINRVEKGYALEIELTSSSTNQYGQQRLKIKAYTEAEYFNVHVWNYSSSAYDTNKIVVSALSNTLYTYDLIEQHHRSGTEVKVKIQDNTAYTSDFNEDSLYVDLAVVSWIHTDPTLTLNSAGPTPVNLGESISFWVNYTDVDNETPSYIKVNIGGTDYVLLENSTGDISFWNGKDYYYSTSALPRGTHDYYFKAKDVNSGEITTSTKQVVVNGPPTLTLDGVLPTTGNEGQSFSFYVTYTDLDNNAPDYIRAVIDGTPYDMTKNTTDTDYTDGCAYRYFKVMTGGSHTYKFTTTDYLSDEVETTEKNLEVNYIPTLGTYDRDPSDPVYPNTLLNFTVVYTDADGDLPTSIKWREDEGATQNITMLQVNSLDLNTVDGKAYYIEMYLDHGEHDYDYYASDGMGIVSGGDNTITIQNRAPTIDNTPSSTTTYRDTYWEWDVTATDLDDDDIGFEVSDNCTFALTINPTTGLLSGTTDTNLGWYDITVYANDSYGGSDSYNFQLSIVNRVPTITTSGNTTQEAGTYMAYHADATDPDSDEISWEFASNATWLVLYGDGWVNGTAEVGIFWCKLWANDSYGGSDLEEWEVTVTSTPSNNAPVLSSFDRDPADPCYVNTLLNFTVLYTDDDGELPTWIKWREDGGSTQNLSMSEVNSLDDDVTDGKWYYIEMYLTHGTHNYDFAASDGIDWTSGGSNSITIQNRDPVITNGPGVDVYEDRNTAYAYDFAATDADSDTIGWEVSGYVWLSINPSTGYLSGTTPDTPGDYIFTVYANDSYSGSDSYQFTLHVQNNDPVITNGPTDPTVHCEDSWYYDFSVTDADLDTITWDVSGAAWLTINPSTGNLSGTTTTVPGDYSFTVYANDSYGGSDNYQFTLHVQNQEPVITNGPVNPVTHCEDSWYYNFDATDADSDTIVWDVSGPAWLSINTADGNLSGTVTSVTGDYSFTVYANDSYGGSDSYQFTLHVQNAAPIITNGPGVAVDEWRNTAWDYDFDATDADEDTIGWEISGYVWLTVNPTSGYVSGTTPDATGYYQFTVYANDSYGGSDSYTFTIHVINRDPVITNGPGVDVYVECEDSWFYDFAATDADTDTIGWEVSGPTWLTINPSTGYLSGTTSAVTGNYVFTVYANDSYGGSDSYQFTMHVQNESPVITDYTSVDVYLDRNVVWYYDFNATDADEDTISWDVSGPAWLTIGASTGNLTGTTTDTPGDYTFTVYANDSYGGSDSYQFTIHIQNNDPVITNGPGVDVYEHCEDSWFYDFAATDSDEDTIEWEISGAIWLTINPSTGYVSGTISSIVGDYTFTVYANDSYGGSDSYQFTIHAQNDDPVITNGPGLDVYEDRNTAWYYDFAATDPDSDTITWDVSGPAWLSINPSTGYLSGTTTDTPGDYSYTVYANDSYGGSDSYTFTMHVQNNDPVIVDYTSSDVYLNRNTVWYFDFNATDADSDTLTWDVSGPVWLTINPSTGNLSGTTPNIAGDYSFTVYANDSYGGSDSYQFTIHVSNGDPIITNGPGADVYDYCNEVYSYDFNATDPDSDTISWDISGAAWLTINPTTGEVSGTITTIPGNYQFTIYANDSYGGSDSYVFTIHAQNRDPTITNGPGADVYEDCNEPYAYDFSATDPDGQTISWDVSGPSWLTINPSTGYLSGTLPTVPGDYSFTIYANDSYGGSDSYQFTLHVQNRDPVITDYPLVDEYEYCNEAWYYDFNGNDPDGQTITWDVSGPAWLSINPSTGNLSGTTTLVPGDYSFTVWANDSYGGSDSYLFTLHVQNRDPIITNGPGIDVYVECNDAWYYDFSATDADTHTVTWDVSGPAWLSINPSTGYLSGTTTTVLGDYSFTIYANDSYGGSDSYTFTMHVENEDPVISNGPGVDVYESRNSAWDYDFDATDPDSDTIAWEISGAVWLTVNPTTGEVSGTTPGTPGDYSFTVWANDSYGGSDSYTFTMHIANGDPVITDGPGTDVYVECNDAWYYDFDAIDPDSDTVSWEVSGEVWLTINPVTGNLSGTTHIVVGDYSFTVWANDSYGGSDSYTFTIHIQNDDPTITTTPTTTTYRDTYWVYDCNAVDLDEDTITFECSTNATFLTFYEVTGIINGTTDSFLGWYTITIWANDSYGGTTLQQFYLSIVNRAPNITSSPTLTFLNGTDIVYLVIYIDADGDVITLEFWSQATFLTLDGDYVNGTANLIGFFTCKVWANDSYGGSYLQQWTVQIYAEEGDDEGGGGGNWVPAPVQPEIPEEVILTPDVIYYMPLLIILIGTMLCVGVEGKAVKIAGLTVIVIGSILYFGGWI